MIIFSILNHPCLLFILCLWCFSIFNFKGNFVRRLNKHKNIITEYNFKLTPALQKQIFIPRRIRKIQIKNLRREALGSFLNNISCAIYLFLLGLTIWWSLMNTSSMACTVVKGLGTQFLSMEVMSWWYSIQTKTFNKKDFSWFSLLFKSVSTKHKSPARTWKGDQAPYFWTNCFSRKILSWTGHPVALVKISKKHSIVIRLFISLHSLPTLTCQTTMIFK